MKKRPDGRSPYKKKNKTPYRYSPLFYEWLAAVKANDVRAAQELGRRHTQAFGAHT